MPADNLLVKEIKKVEIPITYKEAGYQGWSIRISADGQAKIGGREIVFTTSQGKIKGEGTDISWEIWNTPTTEKIIFVNQFDFRIIGAQFHPKAPKSCIAEYEIDLMFDKETLPEGFDINLVMFTSGQALNGGGFYPKSAVQRVKGKHYKLPGIQTTFSGIGGCQGSHLMFLGITDGNGNRSASAVEMDWDDME